MDEETRQMPTSSRIGRAPMLAGLFVGGQGRRMGHVAKGLLVAPDRQPIAVRWARLFEEVGVRGVLVGGPEACARYADVLPSMELVMDDPPGLGPLGGLAALLARASTADAADVITVACDMPLVPPPLLERLVRAPHTAAVLAPRIDGRWQPFFARWSLARALPAARQVLAAGRRSMTAALDAAGAEELALADEERPLLSDWDTPEDVQARRG